MKRLFLLLLLVTSFSQAAILTDERICGTIARDTSGDIKRSTAVLRAFQQLHPCPSTGEKTGPCVGWSIDHVIPLACGGCDKIINMQWLPVQTKSCDKEYCKDRFERNIQYVDPNTVGLSMKSCNPKLLPPEHFQPDD